MGEYGVGQSVPREEDPYLLRGAGRYVDDMAQIGLLRAHVLRSPHAHARIRALDAEAARQKPVTPRKRRGGAPAFACAQLALARDTVRYLGEPVAFVVAQTLNQAKDAA